MSNLLNQKHALAKLKAELEGRKERICRYCRRFGHLAHNCKNKNEEEKGKSILQNRFEVIASRVMQCGMKEKVEIRKQETVEEGVQCFRYWRIGHYKWECPVTKEKKKRRSKEAACAVSLQKAQQGERSAHPKWEKVQKYCGGETVPEDAQLLELGWMTEEVIATYMECRWCGKKGMHRENNREQGVLRGRKLEEAKWCGCSKQKKREEVAARPREEKAQQGSIQTVVLNNAAKKEDRQRDVRRTFKMLREVWLNIGVEKVDTHEGVTVKALLDSGVTGMFMDKKMAAKHGFRLQKLERPVAVRNVDGTNNSEGAIIYQVEVDVYYKSHVERMRMDVCDLGKTDVILGVPWLQAHNPEINWETEEVKMTRCPPLCGRNTKLEKGQKVKKGKRVVTLEEEKMVRWAMEDKED